MDEPQPNNTLAIAALIVSISSATVTLGGLFWQFILYRLQGARLKVELKLRFRSDSGVTVTIAPGRANLDRDKMVKFNKRIGHVGIEYAFVRVTNVGRTAVSVEAIGLDTGRFNLLGRARYSVIPQQFREPDESGETLVNLNDPRRLEPGDNFSVGLHLWPGFAEPNDQRKRRNRPLVVRGTATAVGRRPSLSPRRHAWRISPGAQSIFRDYLPPRETFVYRELWDQNYRSAVGIVPLYMCDEIVEMLEDGATSEELRDFLTSINEKGVYRLVATRVHEVFHNAPTELPPRVPTLKRVLWGQTGRRPA